MYNTPLTGRGSPDFMEELAFGLDFTLYEGSDEGSVLSLRLSPLAPHFPSSSGRAICHVTCFRFHIPSFRFRLAWFLQTAGKKERSRTLSFGLDPPRLKAT